MIQRTYVWDKKALGSSRVYFEVTPGGEDGLDAQHPAGSGRDPGPLGYRLSDHKPLDPKLTDQARRKAEERGKIEFAVDQFNSELGVLTNRYGSIIADVATNVYHNDRAIRR